MLKQVLLIVAFCIGSQADADDCPSFYRFVDFGTFENDGSVSRGGMIFRSFDENADHLLQMEKTECLPIADVAKDGRQLPIPIVSHIEVDMNVANVNVSSLSLTSVENVTDVAEANAEAHRERATSSAAEIHQGDAYLCVSLPERNAISCQIVPPYGGAVLVVYCDALQCEMPVLELSERVSARATWPRVGVNADEVASDIMRRIQSLDLFWEAQL